MRAQTVCVTQNPFRVLIADRRTSNLRIKSLSCTASLTSGFARILLLTCASLFRLVPAVHGCFWLARGFFVGSDIYSPEPSWQGVSPRQSAGVVQKTIAIRLPRSGNAQRSLTSLKRSATTRVSSVISMPDQKLSCAARQSATDSKPSPSSRANCMVI
jgi:hypothetical protein